MKNKVIEVQNVHISISKQKLDDYICITDIAKAKSDSVRAADVVRNWLRNCGTLEYLSVWEQIYNPNFKVFESEHFKKQAGLLTFTPSVSEWVNETNAIGLYVKRGKYGGTYAHKDIAFEFASAISPVFKLYLIKEFQRVTCSHPLNLTILKWGLPARLPFRAKLKQAIPACPAVLFFMFIRLRIFFLCRQAHSL